jgi:hypothetical protein
LHHARERRVAGVVVLTNDGKNDWNMGGEEQPELDNELRKVSDGLPPLPRAHPMLKFESRGTAGVTDLMLVDRAYLAIFLRRTGEPSDRFFGAAVEVTLPSPQEDDKARRKELAASSRPARVPTKDSDATVSIRPRHFPTEDSPNVTDTSLALKIALIASSRAEDEKMRPILDAMLSPAAEGKNVAEFLTAETLKSWDTRGVVWFARTLGTRSIGGDPLATTYATDILSVLDRLPPRTGTCLYLGLLAAAYLDTDEIRAVPRGPWLRQIFNLQSNERAALAIDAFRLHLAGRSDGPIYLPDRAMPTLQVRPLTQTIKGSTPHLTGLQISGTGVIVEAQTEDDYLLSTRFPGRETATVREIVGLACSLLGIPLDQIEQGDGLKREVRFGPTVGIATLADLQKNEEN